MTVGKPKPKQLLRPITTGSDSAMNQSQFIAITCNSLKAQQKSRVHGAIGFGFASRWLKNWRESFKPITKRSNLNHVITFNSHLKTALKALNHICFWFPGITDSLGMSGEHEKKLLNHLPLGSMSNRKVLKIISSWILQRELLNGICVPNFSPSVSNEIFLLLQIIY